MDRVKSVFVTDKSLTRLGTTVWAMSVADQDWYVATRMPMP
jgi:hypothetical protein